MSELLIELFSEEIPARMQGQAADTLQKMITDGLAEAGLAYEHADAYATPRRLALMVSGIPARQPDSREERKGPRVGAPEKALAGFMRGAGVSSMDECEIRDDKKGQFYVAVIERKGRAAEEVLAGLVPEVIAKFPWPKSMRWGAGNLRWVRPLHSIVCVFGPSENGSGIIEFEIEGVRSGNITHGHRFMSPGPIEVRHFSDYEEKLKDAKVLLDPKLRRERIWAEATRLAEAEGLEVVEDARLLDEVAGLVEWPVPLMGRFPTNFLELPKEVLESSMRKHQKYFSLRDPKTGKAANRFIVISNIEAEDGGEAITGGNERVLNARLADARFFWDQDLKTPLHMRTGELDVITFHAKLGSQGERVERIVSLAKDIAPFVDANPDEAAEAAAICKTDLVTEMVGEFPDLQGLMGRYYAEKCCVKPYIAKAIEDHYKPQGPADAVPADPISIAVALADKIDTLVGFWAIDEKPTGSKDPYALRRAALGVIRIVLENGLRLNLQPLFELAKHYHGTDSGEDDLLSFFADRLKVYLRDQGARHDLIDAVFSLGQEARSAEGATGTEKSAQDDLLMIVRRVEALGEFLGTDDGANLLAGVKRASNILRIEEKKDKRSFDGAADPALFAQDEERALFDRIAEATAEANAAVGREDFEAAMAAMATLRAPVDAFFDHVTVNADEPQVRENRLKLLSQIRAATHAVADFSKIAG